MSFRRILPAVSLLIALCAVAPVHATTAVVPDGFPTVQAGIDSGRDTVLVRGGRYDENLTSDRFIALLAYPSSPSSGTVLPQLGSLVVHRHSTPAGDGDLLVRGLRFRGKVGVTSDPCHQATFETCRMDSGLSVGRLTSDIEVVNVSGCTILGGMSVNGMSVHITLNSVYGGGIEVYGEGYYTISGNYVHGPAAFGIKSRDDASSYSWIEGNSVVATETGINPLGSGFTRVMDNEVLDCTGSAFLGALRGTYERNRVARCGGYGFDFYGYSVYGPNLRHNQVVDCASGGVRVTGSCAADSNVVGRCGGPGFDIGQGGLRRNTSYLNQGAGFVVRGGIANITNNIAYGNFGAGLSYLGTGAPSLACNDWFANTGGATSGTLPGPTDLVVDPLFCDVGQDDVHLSDGSALLSQGDCGMVGALGQGCVDVPTPALLSLVGVEEGADGIKLTWLAGGSKGAVATVYRSPVGGEWTRIGEVTADGTGYLRYTDPIDATTTRLGYRLGMVEAGIESFYGETWVDLPAGNAPLAFALGVVRPNPTRGGALSVRFTLPSGTAALVELLDVAGRRIASHEVGSLGAGQHTLDLGQGQHFAPGLYLVRLTQGANTRTTRVAVLQ
jgi:hypothetical protein